MTVSAADQGSRRGAYVRVGARETNQKTSQNDHSKEGCTEPAPENDYGKGAELRLGSCFVKEIFDQRMKSG